MIHVLATTLLHDSDPQVRRSAAIALEQDACVEEERAEAIESLVRALNDPHVAVQEAAMASLVSFNPSHVATQILPVLHGTVQHRNLAIEVLQRLGPSTLPVLLCAMTDSDEHIRKFLVDVIGHIGGVEAVEGLLNHLHDLSPNVRAAVIESLGNLGDQRAVAPLISMTDDREEWVVFSAISALGNLKNAEAVPKLQDLLCVEETVIRGAVIEALGKIGDPHVLPDLLAMLPTARIPLRHLLFVTIVELVGDQADIFQREELRDYLFHELVQALNTRDPDVQLAALRGLRLLGDAKATSALLRFLECQRGGQEDLETAVLSALTQIGDEQELLEAAMNGSERVALFCIDALSTRHVTHAVSALGELVVQSHNREIRRAALVALGQIGFGAEGTSAVVAALDDHSGCVRAEAARIVADTRIQGTDHALWNRVDIEPYADVIAEQVRAIIQVQTQDTVTTLQAFLQHHRPEVREAAIVHWPDVHPPAVRQLLDPHVDDTDWRVRLALVERLLHVSDPRLVDLFIRASSDPHPHVRQAAVQALGQFPGKAVCATLRAVIVQDPDLWVRTRAVEQLERLHDVGSSSLLVQALNHSPFPLQKAIVKALGTIGDITLVGVLQEMERHQDPEIKEAARVAIRQLMTSPSPSEVMV